MQLVEAEDAEGAVDVDRLHPHARGAAQHRQQVGQRRVDPVNLAVDQRVGGGGGIGDDVPFDAVDHHPIAAGAEADRFRARIVFFVFRIHRPAAGHVFIGHPAERAAADHLRHLLERVGQRQALGHDHRAGLGAGQRIRQGGERLAEAPDQGAVVGGLQRIEPGLDGLADLIALHPAPQRGHAVARQHRRAVVEEQPLAQLHGPAQAAILDQMAFQHLRLGVEFFVAAVQRLEQQVGVVAADHRRRPDRVEAGQVGLRDVDDRLGAPANGRCLGLGPGGGKRGGGAREEAAAFHGVDSGRCPQGNFSGRRSGCAIAAV